MMSTQAQIEQELIFTDHKVTDSAPSDYYKISYNLLKKNIEYLELTYDKLLKFRLKKINKRLEERLVYCDPDYPWTCFYDTFATFEDGFTGYKGDLHQTNPEGKDGEKRKRAEELRDEEYDEYLEKIEECFSDEISYPHSSITLLKEYMKEMGEKIQ